MDILGKGILFLSVAKFVCKSEEKRRKKKKKILENRKLYWSICRKVFAPTLVMWVG
jgi:hypothetical protein